MRPLRSPPPPPPSDFGGALSFDTSFGLRRARTANKRSINVQHPLATATCCCGGKLLMLLRLLLLLLCVRQQQCCMWHTIFCNQLSNLINKLRCMQRRQHVAASAVAAAANGSNINWLLTADRAGDSAVAAAAVAHSEINLTGDRWRCCMPSSAAATVTAAT